MLENRAINILIQTLEIVLLHPKVSNSQNFAIIDERRNLMRTLYFLNNFLHTLIYSFKKFLVRLQILGIFHLKLP